MNRRDLIFIIARTIENFDNSKTPYEERAKLVLSKIEDGLIEILTPKKEDKNEKISSKGDKYI